MPEVDIKFDTHSNGRTLLVMKVFFVKYGSCLLLALAGFLFGCGSGGNGMPSLVKVKGTIHLDGQPIGGATVLFTPVVSENAGANSYGRGSMGVTGDDGTYGLTTIDPNDGIPVGEYLVGVSLVLEQGGPQKDPVTGELLDINGQPLPEFGADPALIPPSNVTYVVPQQYGDPKLSGLTVKVTKTGMEPAILALSSQ